MEEWREVPGFTGIYSVSNWGRVRIEVSRHNIRAGAILREFAGHDAYRFVSLNRNEFKGSKGAPHHVARLVLATFAGAPGTRQANHCDGDIRNNHLSNLEWVTVAENVRHSIQVLGRDRKGESNPCARVTLAAVVTIRERAAQGEAYDRIARDFGVTGQAVKLIATGKTWPTAPGPISSPPGRGRR